MGRIPCCEKVGIKKGPWTPEEDIILVSFIQEHGPGNWRSVPTNTGLRRCSKSCRLRWTNYLRPGIKRGSFTEQEEKMIIHLQALLGNKWAAIASYLPQRTDNDIKNYWNTHLKKKLNKGGQDGQNTSSSQENNNMTSNSSSSSTSYNNTNKGQWERRLQTDINRAKQALCEALSLDKPDLLPSPRPSPASYAASAENIARLLENWTACKPPGPGPNPKSTKESTQNSSTTKNTNNTKLVASSRVGFGFGSGPASGSGSSPSNKSITLDYHNQGYDSLLGFHSNSNNPSTASENNSASVDDESKPNLGGMMTSAMDVDHHQVPVSLIEKWLFEEAGISQDPVSLLDMTSLDDDPSSDLF